MGIYSNTKIGEDFHEYFIIVFKDDIITENHFKAYPKNKKNEGLIIRVRDNQEIKEHGPGIKLFRPGTFDNKKGLGIIVNDKEIKVDPHAKVPKDKTAARDIKFGLKFAEANKDEIIEYYNASEKRQKELEKTIKRRKDYEVK